MENLDDMVIQGANEILEYLKGDTSKAKRRTVRIDPLPDFSANEIKGLRVASKLSQSSFALILGVSKKTVEAWEAGINQPSGAARRLLTLIRDDPKYSERIENLIFVHESAK